MVNKNKKINKIPWLGIAITLIVASVLAYNLFSGDKTFFLAGDTTHGHYQIELKCESCHSAPFSEKSVMQDACESCHAAELDKVNDSHPKSAFLDPRNAELLSQLDARFCVTCHREHKPEITRQYGVTLAEDFCFHCHQEIAEDRDSHKEFKFDTCATSGCHNFHDNSMLYEKFLWKHMDEPDNKKSQQNPLRTELKKWIKKSKKEFINVAAEPDIEAFIQDKVTSEAILSATELWSAGIHSKVEANCQSCHTAKNEKLEPLLTIDSVEETCATCHKKQQQTFLQGKHGMRLALDLPAMSTAFSRSHKGLKQEKLLSCSSCHNPHSVDVKVAAVEACVDCHQDKHTLNYRHSKHFQLWQKEVAGELTPGSGVSCSTCHLPRIKRGRNVTVIHNQNINLRPNVKMLRTVCMNCHGMEFSISALADKQLVENNFIGAPNKQHKSFELIKKRVEEASQSKKQNEE